VGWVYTLLSWRLDYCNSLFYNIPAYQLQKLQRIQNATARLILQESKFCHITPLLMTLQWLPVTVNIQFILKYRIYPCALFFLLKKVPKLRCVLYTDYFVFRLTSFKLHSSNFMNMQANTVHEINFVHTQSFAFNNYWKVKDRTNKKN